MYGSRSIRVTLIPARARPSALSSPTGPAPTISTSSRVIACCPSVLDRMPPFRHQHRALETHELRAIGFLTDGAHGDDALRGPRRRLALRQHFGFRVNRVADEHRGRQHDGVPTEIADRFLTDVADAHTHYDGQRQATIHDRLTEL